MSENFEHIHSFDGVRIPTIVNIPGSVVDSQRCIVLLHGLTTSKNEYQNAHGSLASELAMRGRQSVRFDFRGHGDSEVSLAQFNIHNQILDTLSVIKWAQQSIGVKKFTILGTSFGAPVGIYSSYILQNMVRKVVLVAPVLDFHRTFIYPETQWGKETFGFKKVSDAVFSNRLDIDNNFNMSRYSALDLMLFDPKSIITKLICKVSILHGTDDGMVPFAVSKQLTDEYKHISFFPLSRTGHGLAEIGDDSRVSTRTKNNTLLLVEQLIGEE